jgi:hypothetical protein
MRDLALTLTETGMSTPAGEPITDPSDLPDGLDDLLDLLSTLTELSRVVGVLRREVEAKAGGVLGPGHTHVYGESKVSYSRPWKWRPIAGAAVAFVEDLQGSEITDVFNVNQMRKTGVEKVARGRGLDPSVVVDTVLDRERAAEPKISLRPLENK